MKFEDRINSETDIRKLQHEIEVIDRIKYQETTGFYERIELHEKTNFIRNRIRLILEQWRENYMKHWENIEDS